MGLIKTYFLLLHNIYYEVYVLIKNNTFIDLGHKFYPLGTRSI